MSRLALLPLVCVALVTACGEEPDDPPPVFQVEAPRGVKSADFLDAGMSLTRPVNWRLRQQRPPEVFELVSGEAVIAAWAYPRVEPLPQTEAELEAAKDRLVEAIQERDPRFPIESAVVSEVAGAPAIDVTGQQVLSRRTLMTRSVHVFEGEVEYVIEAIAPPRDFSLVDERVLTPILDSLELEGEITEDTG